MVVGKEAMLMDVSIDDGIGLDVYFVSAAIGFDAQRKVGVWVHVPVEAAEEP